MLYYICKAWQKNAAAIFFQVLQYSGKVAWSLLMILLFQKVIELDFAGVVLCCMAELLVSAGRNGCSSLSVYFQSQAVRQMNNLLRQDMAATLLQKSRQEYHAQESGEYLSQLTNEINQIEQLAWRPFYTLVGLAAEVTLSMAALLNMHWTILVAALFTAGVMILLPKLFRTRLEGLGAQCASEQALAVGKLKNLLAGYDVLRFFDRKSLFSAGIQQASEQMEIPRSRQQWITTAVGNGLDYVSTIIQILLFVWISYLSICGVIIQSAAAGGGNLCGSVYGGLCQIANLQLSFASSKPYFDKIKVHAADGAAAPAPDLPAFAQAIAVEDVSFDYGAKPVLEHLSLRFEKGGKYALTGPSGCGKSTLLKLLLGWLPEYTGHIRFDGVDAREATPEQLQRQMSYIEQNVFLFNTTIRENITLGEPFTDAQLERVVRDSALAGDLVSLPDGLDTVVGEEGGSLSGGQKQRVAIARALIHNRSILLVDEGTSALDAKNAAIVEDSLLQNPELTLILVSHHLTPERRRQFSRVYELQPAGAAQQ